MNFNVGTVASEFSVGNAFDSVQSDRISQREKDSVNVVSPTSMSDFDVIGLNIVKVEPAKEAIREMCRQITEKISQIQTDANSKVAFKLGNGDFDSALKSYLEKVVLYCENLTSSLLAFNDKISEVQKQWDKLSSNTQEKVSSTSGQFATGSKYTEQNQ